MYFDEQAASWDTPARLERAAKLAAKVLEHWGTTQLETVLEFGCGTGALTAALGDRAPRFFGYDSSPEMLAVYRAKADGARHTALASLAELPAGGVDAVVASMVLHHVPDLQHMLRELAGVLAPGGLLTVIDLDAGSEFFHRDVAAEVFHHGFAREAFAGALRGAGFAVSCVETALDGVKRFEDGSEHPYSLFIATAKKAAATGGGM